MATRCCVTSPPQVPALGSVPSHSIKFTEAQRQLAALKSPLARLCNLIKSFSSYSIIVLLFDAAIKGRRVLPHTLVVPIRSFSFLLLAPSSCYSNLSKCAHFLLSNSCLLFTSPIRHVLKKFSEVLQNVVSHFRLIPRTPTITRSGCNPTAISPGITTGLRNLLHSSRAFPSPNSHSFQCFLGHMR